jgi:hypothetical protein
MSELKRQAPLYMVSTADAMTSEPVEACGETQSELQLQDILFSELLTSACYWSAVLLLAVAGATLIYWHLTHPGSSTDVGSDPFGVATSQSLIMSLPPIGVAASLAHAAWGAVRGQRVWRMLATAAGLIAVMGVTIVLETHAAL